MKLKRDITCLSTGPSLLVPLSQGAWSIVDQEDSDLVTGVPWALVVGNGNKHGYANRSKAPKQGALHRIIAMRMFGPLGNLEVDHINGLSLDNRRRNIRVCTPLENSRNKGMTSRNTSGHKGCFWHKRQRKWNGTIRVEKVAIHLGCFDSLEECAVAYQKAAEHYFGAFKRPLELE